MGVLVPRMSGVTGSPHPAEADARTATPRVAAHPSRSATFTTSSTFSFEEFSVMLSVLCPSRAWAASSRGTYFIG
jgi:hypothetical protein